MSTNKNIDKICCVIVVITILLSVFAMGINALDIDEAAELGYELKLFDDSYVHTIDIVMDDWDGFIETCENEEYSACTVIIDGETFKNTAIRAKGNTSLSSVSQYGNDRYSFKIEFDQYEENTYYGLDKLSLNNIIQDNTYMKDYLVYTLMNEQGVAAPLCSFVNIKINGENFGLYLAVEAVEDSFLQRNYGSEYGELYKPDSMNMGGGRGNGKDFSEDAFSEIFANDETTQTESALPDDFELPESFELPENFTVPENADVPEASDSGDNTATPQMPDFSNRGGFSGKGGNMSNGSSDVLLQYTDDNYSSYTNIFDNAKTDITDSDKDRLINSLKILGEGNEIDSCVDVDAVIRYFAVHNFVCNFDSYTGQMIHNYYLYEKDGILSMIPWDYNLAFGGFMSGADATSLVNFPVDSPVSGGDTTDRPMIAWIFNNEEYTELYHKYMSEFIADVFDSGWFEVKFTEISEMIAAYVENDPTAFCTYEEFTKGVQTLKTFCELRAESVKGQLEGTIPATSDGQSEDSASLIDASDLNVNSMGSMGRAMGGNKNGDFSFGRFGKSSDTQISDNTQPSDNNSVPDNSSDEISEASSVQSVSVSETPTVKQLSFINAVTDSGNGQFSQQGGIPQGNPFSQNGEMPQGDMGSFTPPEMPEGDMGSFTPPEMPEGDMGSFTPPEMPQGDTENVPTPETSESDSDSETTPETSQDSTVNTQETESFAQEEKNFDRGAMGQQPGAQLSGATTQASSQEVILLAGCVVILVCALIFAKSFKRYKYPR